MNADGEKASPWDPRLYDDSHSFVWKHGTSLVDLLAPRAGETILDLGCGTGHLTAQIAHAGASVIGLDRSPEMIEQARQSYPTLTYLTADARALEFVEQFDAVFSNAVLHWVPQAEEVVQGVARALKPGGRFVAELGGRGNVRILLAALQTALQELHCPLVESPWFFPSVAEYARLLEEHGLEVSLAMLFDRPTRLEGEQGMRQWVEMFGHAFLTGVPEDRREDYLRRVQENARPSLRRNGAWFADYRRLRVVAHRQG